MDETSTPRTYGTSTAPAYDFDDWVERHRVRAVRARLEDLSGLDRPKRAIASLAWALRHPDELRAAGGTVPAAVLLTGPVGCGKTSLARALAGLVADDVIFVEAVASELTPEIVSALVGFAASSPRPVTVFVDELSWLGADRTSRLHDPASRAALMALLAAVSGIREGSGTPILWVGATSDDPATLDDALTRSGRFARVIEVRAPGPATRRAHLERRIRDRRSAGSFDLDRLVGLTAGASYADLDQAVDDALAAALTDGGPEAALDQAHLEEAIRSGGRTDDEPEQDADDRYRIAIHEAAHAIVGHALTPGAVKSVSCALPRGGVTRLERPEEPIRRLRSDRELRQQITILLAGAEGERIAFPEAGVSTGSRDDMTSVATLIVERHAAGIDSTWGGSWPSWLDTGSEFANRRTANYEAFRAECAAAASTILVERRDQLHELASLLEAEGDLAGDELWRALNGRPAGV